MRRTYREGGGFEEAAAYSRAVRIGPHVAVSGTAAREGGDAYAQTRRGARAARSPRRRELGAAPEDVLRTRLLLAPGCDWEGAVRAHREAFAGRRARRTRPTSSRGSSPRACSSRSSSTAIVAEPPR